MTNENEMCFAEYWDRQNPTTKPAKPQAKPAKITTITYPEPIDGKQTRSLSYNDLTCKMTGFDADGTELNSFGLARHEAARLFREATSSGAVEVDSPVVYTTDTDTDTDADTDEDAAYDLGEELFDGDDVRTLQYEWVAEKMTDAGIKVCAETLQAFQNAWETEAKHHREHEGD